MEWVSRIRAELQNTHDSIESLPISHAMIHGTIKRSEYLALLEQLVYVHATFETHLANLTQYANLVTPDMFREESLRRDIVALSEPTESCHEPWASTEVLTAMVQEWHWKNPHRLLGMLYVLEGSRMGSLFLWRSLSQALGVQGELGHGLDYHLEGIKERGQTWIRFKQTLGAWDFTDPEQSEIIVGAVETMKGLYRIYNEASHCKDQAPSNLSNTLLTS